MPAVLAFLFAVLLAAAPAAHGFEIVAVESARLAPYETAMEAFRAEVDEATGAAGPRTAVDPGLTRLVLTEPGARDRLEAILEGRRPDLLLAVGNGALRALQAVDDVPILYLLAPSLDAALAGRSNVTGVRMEIPAARWLDTLAAALPTAVRVGLVYDPRRTGRMVAEARAAARAHGLSLVAEAVDRAPEVPAALDRLASRIDAYWMLPDLTVVTPQTVESLLLFSLERRVPVLTFSEKYLDRGATLALTLDFAAMGRQAGGMARRILAGVPPARIPAEAPAAIRVQVNRTVAEKLGTPILAREGNP